MFKFMEEIREKLKSAFDEKQAEILAEVIYKSYESLVKASDFNELKEIVRELAEAQKRTEERLNQLTERVDELAEAQKRTEERLNQLTERVDQLAEAQRRTEERLNSFIKTTEENFNKVWAAINQLTEQVRNLTVRIDRLSKEVGGISNTVGYILENEAIKNLPKILKRNYKVDVKGKLKRTFVVDKYGGYVEVNIFGEALKNGTKYTIVGECKSQLSKNNVDDFIRKKLKRLEGVFPKIFPVLVVHMISEPDAEEYAKEKGVAVFYSYEF